MRKSFKLFSCVLAAVMIMMSFSAIVAADGAAKVLEGETDYYSYQLWDDGGLVILPHSFYGNIDLNLLDFDALLEKTPRAMRRLYIEDKLVSSGPSIRSYTINGNGCIASYISFSCFSDVDAVSLRFNGFPNATFESFRLPENVDCSVTLDPELEEITVPKGNFYLTGDKVKKAIIEDGTEIIESLAGCTALTEVVIPNSVTYLQYSCFADCRSLKSIDLPDSVETIKPSSFANTGLESIRIPSGVSSILAYVFRDCASLKEVYIPANVTEINAYAFSGCTALKDVYFDGTEAQWNNIKVIDKENGKTLKEAVNNATIHFTGEVQTGWVKDGDFWMYYKEDGNPVKNDWLQLNGKWYHFNEEGYMAFDFTKIGNDTYYFKTSGEMVTGWVHKGTYWYYLNTNGKMAFGWKQIGGKWYYFQNEPGYEPSGFMLTGWQKLEGKWYYLDPSNGDMKTGWTQIGSKWYYLKSDGVMVTGWLQLGSTWYYLKSDGAMVTGWQQIGGKWYYFNAGGDMKTGWLKLGSSWYYLKSSGEMATGKVDIGGRTYEFSNSGVWKG